MKQLIRDHLEQFGDIESTHTAAVKIMTNPVSFYRALNPNNQISDARIRQMVNQEVIRFFAGSDVKIQVEQGFQVHPDVALKALEYISENR